MAQQTVVDEHAGELVTDGLVQQRRHDRRIDTAGEPEQHVTLAHLRAHARDGVVDDAAGVPVGGAAADVVQEACIEPRALLGVGDLGMELQRVEAPRFVGHAADGQVGGRGDDLEPGRELGDAIAVAHPDIEQAVAFGVHAVFDALQQSGVTAGADLCIAELVHRARLDATAQLRGHGLHAVADAEHRHTQRPDGLGCGGRALLRDGLGAAREDDALRIEGPHRLIACVPGVDLAVDAELAHAARDELRVLRPEVEDQDTVGVDVAGGHGRRFTRSGSSGLLW